MSDRSVSITIGTTGSIRHVNGVKLAGDDKDKMYEAKQSKKMIRVLTVIAYMFTVSFAAIMLSVYYVFLWHPRDAERRHYVEVALSKAAPKCPTTSLETTRVPAMAASARPDKFPTTPREEVTTEESELVTSRPVGRTMDNLMTRDFVRNLYPVSSPELTEYEDT